MSLGYQLNELVTVKSIFILIIIVCHHDIRPNRESDEIIMNENKMRFILHFIRLILSLHRKSIC